MSELDREMPSPFPPGTVERVTWMDSEGRGLPGADGAVAGEVELTFPDGTTEHTFFTTSQAAAG